MQKPLTLTHPKAEGAEKAQRGRIRNALGRFKDSLRDSVKVMVLAGAIGAAAAACTFDSHGIPAPAQDAGSDMRDAVAAETLPKDTGGEDRAPAEAGPDARQDAGHDTGTDTQTDSQLNPWWDYAWKYCRQISLSGSFPAGYSHRIVLNSSDFTYAHAKADLSDIRFLEGTCGNPDKSTGILPAWPESVNPAGDSQVWILTKSGSAPSVAMYYGNPAAAKNFDGKAVFLAFGKDSDYSGFTEIDNRNALSVGANGLAFANYPWGNGSGDTYMYRDVSDLSMDFVYDFTIKYTDSAECRPYLSVGVADIATGLFDNANNGIAYTRIACTVASKTASLRVRKMSGVADNLDSSFTPADNTTYYARILRAGTSATLSFYPSKADRESAQNALFSVSSQNSPAVNLRYVYAAIPLANDDSTNSTSGVLNETIVRKAVSPEPSNSVDATEQTY